MRRMRNSDHVTALEERIPGGGSNLGDSAKECPECGVRCFFYKNRAGGEFFGCRRFPLCLGSRVQDSTLNDSLRLLMLRAHSLAVEGLVDLLGKKLAVEWWLSSGPTQLIKSAYDPIMFEALIDKASAVTQETDTPRDFLVEAYNQRAEQAHLIMAGRNHCRMHWDALYTRGLGTTLLTPKFTKRWDTSELRMAEFTLLGKSHLAPGDYCPKCGAFSLENIAPGAVDVDKPGFRKRFGGPATRAFTCPKCGVFHHGVPASKIT